MDPLSLIVTALISGATAGLSDSATDAVKAAYAGLKKRLQGLFGEDPAAQVALDQHAADPQTWRAPLEKALADHGAMDDDDVLALARALMAAKDPHGAAEGKYDLRGAQGVQIGDHNAQQNDFRTYT